MKMRNIWKMLLFAAATQTCFSSCNDFLSIEPENEIVLEKYWTAEGDVNSVLNACYAQLENSQCIERMIVWGELRSDNMKVGSGTGTDLREILKENILETNRYTQWDAFYKAINYCNTVLHYAQGVKDKDPNFTESEYRAVMAEATTLRALCYFYLIRTFRDVPYVTQPSIDDSQDYQVKATPFDEVLDNLISDVERVKEDAVRSYGEESVENSCRITRWACYALLADLYLWQGDYQKCVEYCDLVINEKIRQYEELYDRNPSTIKMELYENKYPLISESAQGSTRVGRAYTEIFGTGNSFESIFELIFPENRDVTNSAIGSLYGSRNTRGQLGVAENLAISPYLQGGTNPLFTKSDVRWLEFIDAREEAYIDKYVRESESFLGSTTDGSAPEKRDSENPRRGDNYANWIIYRLTDVMLMRAEAEVELAGDIPEGGTATEEQLEHYRSAFELVMAVWRRGNNKRQSSTDLLKFEDYSGSRQSMEDLVYAERQRELIFEGKRWFDLVRQCRRDGNNDRMIRKVEKKFTANVAMIRVKLSTNNILYWPYNRSELKQNPFLKQNPAYVTDNTEINF